MRTQKIILISFFTISVISCGNNNDEEQKDPAPSGTPATTQTEVVQPEITENLLLCTVLNDSTDCFSHNDIQSTDIEKAGSKLARCIDLTYAIIKVIAQEIDHPLLNLDRKTLGEVVEQMRFISECGELSEEPPPLEELKKYAQCMLEALSKIKSVLKCN